ncbi:MAG: sterol desaturase/sphingolipid hydroxylase (fatty acid hydroxylase superfamily) [Crocinitomicaceae bacterium]|jgi:sterol desaturase/sphingolipid hydroxylase (fatty acid hydroxylase superfamily)
MLDLYFKLPDPIIFAIPIFALFIVVEFFALTRRRKKKYDKAQSYVSIGMGAGASLIKVFNRIGFFFLFWFLYEHAIFDELGPEGVDGFFNLDWHLDHWYVWVLLFFLDDLTFYTMHRIAHMVRFLWAGHVNHHSSNEFNLAIALRQGWWEYLIKFFFWAWLPFLGFHPLMVFLMIELNLIYQFFVHTELVNKLGVLEYFMNTPSHHRVHHSSQVEYLDKNYAGILIVWDRLFGTFKAEDDKIPVVYGLTTPLTSTNIFVVAFHEFQAIYRDVRRAKGFKNKINYLLQAPGWSHDGKDMRSRTLQQELKKIEESE